MRRAATLLAALELLALHAAAQPSTPTYRAAFAGPFADASVVITGAPYSGRQLSNVFNRPAHEWLYRDAEGRTRTERPLFSPPTADLEYRQIAIVDPIGGYQYLLDPVNRIAHRIKNPSSPSRKRPTPHELQQAMPGVIALSLRTLHFETLAMDRPAWPAPTVTTHDLGTQSIDGVLARGIRAIPTYPPGTVTASPLVVITEAWISDERKLVLLSKRDDPVNGSWLTRLTEYKPGDPDPALFQIPAGFTVIDETGPFCLDIAMPRKSASR